MHLSVVYSGAVTEQITDGSLTSTIKSKTGT